MLDCWIVGAISVCRAHSLDRRREVQSYRAKLESISLSKRSQLLLLLQHPLFQIKSARIKRFALYHNLISDSH